MPYLKTPQGIDWYYEVCGEGVPLLFLHGFGVDSRIWRQQYKYFSDEYQAIAVDLPGHGKTVWQEVTLTDMAQAIELLFRQLGCGPVGIIASSFGGLVALKLFEINIQRIKFLIFAGSQPKFCRSHDYPFGLEVERIHKLASQLREEYPAIVNIFFRSLFTRHERATRRYKWVQTFKKIDTAPQKEALLALLMILEKEDLRPILYSLRLPILFINGTEDYICQKSFYEGLPEKIPTAHFSWFENCGHFPFLSQPHEFNRIVDSFLKSEII